MARSAHPVRPLNAVRRLRRNLPATAAFVLLASLIAAAWLAPLANPNNIESLDWSHVAVPPSLSGGHWFGTDRLGRDLFARTLEGIRVSLTVGLAASAISLLVGIGYGAVAGYAGGLTDQVMMRGIEVLSGLPLIFFVIFLTVIFGQGRYLLFLAIGAVGWLTMARLVRGQTLSLRRREFVEAAVVCGAGSGRIIRRQIIPNLLAPVIVYATLSIPQIILFESFLSFLGLGVQEPHSSLGTLIAEGAVEMETAPWMLVVPGGFLATLMLSLTVLGDGMQDALDVEVR